VQRLQLFELEDQPWVPRVWRDGATDLLDVLFARLGMYRPAAAALGALMATTGVRDWFDLCSGGGGGALTMRTELMTADAGPLRLTLTDRYPNAAAMARVAALAEPDVSYRADAVDARAVARHPPAIRTMFGALHHFPPDIVRDILRDAVAAGAPVAFVDVAASPVRPHLPLPLVPLVAVPNLVMVFVVALLVTPLVRPFQWSRLFWTYVLPVIPLIFAWDGTVSALRAYTPEELLDLARGVPDADRYRWASARAGRVICLTGSPAGGR